MKKVFSKEADVKSAVKEVLKKNDAWYFMPAMNGYGRAGIPDFVCCHKGRFIAIETKYGHNTLTPHQWREIQDITEHDGITIIINESNIDELDTMLKAISALEI